MAINLTLFPTTAPAVIYWEDGTSTSIAAQETRQLQIPDGSFCTISSTVDVATGEPVPPSGKVFLAFAQMMVDFWQSMLDEATGPQATPL